MNGALAALPVVLMSRFYLKAEESENGLNLQYCNGQKRYDFSSNEGFCYPGCDPKYYHLDDLSPQAWRRAYVAALFAEDERLLTAVGKYQMLVPGSPLNRRDKARDLAAKERLQEQVSPDTHKDRKRFYEAWRKVPCCADDCDQYCDQCPNGGIKSKPIPSYGLDTDVRRFITKYGRYQTASELEREDKSGKENSKPRSTPIFSGVRNRKSDNDAVRVRGQKGDGLFSEPAQVPSGQSEGVEKMLSSPIGENLVT